MPLAPLAPVDASALAVRRLRESAHDDGGWAYAPGGSPQVEPTVFALLALGAAELGPHEAIAKGLNFLERLQMEDGSFRVRGGYPRSIWPTPFAALALASLRPESPALPRAVRCLLNEQSQTLEATSEYRADFDIDPTIPGWSWTEGTFAWVEPTAWVVMALKAAGLGGHVRARDGLRLLFDRAFDEGGINYGNRRVFGRPTEPVAGDTAVWLLAAADEPDHPRLAAARRFLHEVAATHADLEDLCWVRLALSAWADRDAASASVVASLADRIAELHTERDGRAFLVPSTMREALTVLALAPGFRFAVSPTQKIEANGGGSAKKKPGWSDRLGSSLRGLMVRAVGKMRPVTVPAAVHIAQAASYDAPLADLVWSQYAAFRTAVPLKDRRVVLKPNMVEYHPDKAINTHPRVVAAAIELCKREGAKEIIVAEGPGHWRNVEHILTASGLGAVLERAGVRFVDLNLDDPVELPNLGRCTKMENLYLAKTVAEADVLISLPKLKTHHWAGVTLSLKNLFGAMPGQCYGWPKNELHWHGIDNSIVDIALTRTPDLALVDGIVGMEGDGPLNGEAKPMGVLVMGADPLAVDATCCRVMGLLPEKVAHLALGEERRLGVLQEKDIVQLGAAIADLRKPFEPHPRFGFLKAEPAPTAAAAVKP